MLSKLRNYIARTKDGREVHFTVRDEGDPNCRHKRFHAAQRMLEGRLEQTCLDCSYRATANVQPDWQGLPKWARAQYLRTRGANETPTK